MRSCIKTQSRAAPEKLKKKQSQALHERLYGKAEEKMSVLDTIAEKTRERVIAAKAADPDLPDRVLKSVPLGAEADEILPFEAALKKERLSYICEVKRASPSKGLIAPVFPYTEIAGEYERAGADAISCLTEPYWFRGSLDILREIR